MAEEKTGKKAAKEEVKMLRVKVIAKNPKLAKDRGGKSIIPFTYNGTRHRIPEGEEFELPEGAVKTLKAHLTKQIVPTGEKSFVKGKNFKEKIIHSFEVVEL